MTHHRTARNLTITPVETLEDRLVLTAIPSNPLESLVALKGGTTLVSIYTEYVNYVQSGGKGTFNPSEANQIEFNGTSVGVDIRFGSGSFRPNVAQMQSIGMQVTGTVPSLGIVEGFYPIARLPTIAIDSNQSRLNPIDKPVNAPKPDSISIPTAPVGPTKLTVSSPVSVVTLKGGPVLGRIYQEYLNYEKSGAQGAFNPVEAGQIEFSGTSVKLDIRATPGNFNTMLGELKALGMQVTATATQLGVIEGYLPIACLPTVASNSLLIGMSPVYRPSNNQGSSSGSFR